MRCAYCGHENPPGTRLCEECKFILREVDPDAFDIRPPTAASAGPVRRRERRHREKNRKLTITLISIVVGVVLTLAAFVLGNTYTSDPSMNALLWFEYQYPTDTKEGSVRVFGTVYNNNNEDVYAKLDILITDIYGHSSSETAEVGLVHALGSLHVSQTFPWPHPCQSIDDIEVGYGILTKSAGWF